MAFLKAPPFPAGVNAKATADRLGHHSAGLTLDRHVHALDSLHEDAADRLQDTATAARNGAVKRKVTGVMRPDETLGPWTGWGPPVPSAFGAPAFGCAPLL